MYKWEFIWIDDWELFSTKKYLGDVTGGILDFNFLTLSLSRVTVGSRDGIKIVRQATDKNELTNNRPADLRPKYNISNL